MKITVDMFPAECSNVIKFFYSTMFPEGLTLEELKNSEHHLLQRIGEYFEKDVIEDDGNRNECN